MDRALKVLVFDTETTGMVSWRKPETDPAQPHLIQLGMVLVETGNWQCLARHSLLIRLPEEVAMEEGALQAHGIEAEKCREFGVPLSVACDLFRETASNTDFIVAHNLKFDRIVMAASLFRAGSVTDWMEDLRWLCTMETAAPVLRLPGREGQFKWPTLAQAYEHFSGQPLQGAHDALVDAEACLTVFRGLVEVGAVEV